MTEHYYIDKSRYIPVLCPEPTTVGNEIHHPSSKQPMIAFKEFEIDQVRYQAWKSSLLRPSKSPKFPPSAAINACQMPVGAP